MRKYVLMAGVNGAGKSTLYQSLSGVHDIPRVNTDEIVREFGIWSNPTDVMKAGKIAIQQIQDFFINKVSFNQETTLCGKSILRNIKKAKESRYTVEMHYVGVESPDIAIERVHSRVEHGGHGIPDGDVRRRYFESFVQLKGIINQIDLLALYDNTVTFHRFAIYRNGEIVKISHNCPDWFYKYIYESDKKEN